MGKRTRALAAGVEPWAGLPATSGSVLRSTAAGVRSWVALTAGVLGWVNVTDYGAAGDGVTNDSAAIASAITAAGAGSVVYFPPGTYLTNASLTPLAGQTLAGAGRRVSFLKVGAAFSGSNGIIFVTSVARVTIADLGFTGHASVQQAAVYVSGSTDALFQRCYADANCQRLALAAGSSHRCRVSYCLSDGTNASNAIEFNGSNYCSAEFCTLLNAGGNGVEIYQNGSGVPIIGTRVIGCHIESGSNYGIITFGDNDSILVENTIVSCAKSGIFVDRGEVDTAVISQRCTVADNVVRSCATSAAAPHGITINTTTIAADVQHNTVEGCGNTSSGGAGIIIYGDNNTVNGNISAYNQTHGIYDQGSDNIITNNTCYNNSVIANSSDGIRVSSPATRNYIAGNRTFDNRGTQLQAQGIQLTSGANSNVVVGNDGNGNKFNALVDGATGNVKHFNSGYISENSGTATVASGQTTIAVSHGLAATPTRVFVTPTNSLGSAAKFYVDTLTSSQFTIHTDIDPGATTAIFNWRAQVGEG